MISTAIMTAVSAITRRVFFSAVPRSGEWSCIWQLPCRSFLGAGDIENLHYITNKLLVRQTFSELLGDSRDGPDAGGDLGKKLKPGARLKLVAPSQCLP